MLFAVDKGGHGLQQTAGFIGESSGAFEDQRFKTQVLLFTAGFHVGMFSFQIGISVSSGKRTSSRSPQGSTLEWGGDSAIQGELGEAAPRRPGDVGQTAEMRGGGEEVVGFQDGAGTSSGSKTVHNVSKCGVHLLFVSLTHTPHTVMSLRVKILVTK